MNPIRLLLSHRGRRPAMRRTAQLRCCRLEDRMAPASFQGLGFLPGGNNSTAHDVSANGSVVVGNASVGGDYYAFRWTAATGMVQLPAFLVSYSSANGVSADGSVIVGSSGHAFRWNEATGNVDLGTLYGEPYSYAYGVSDNGSVIVGSSGYPQYAFRWTQTPGMADLGTPPGGSNAGANGVSGDGLVVVGRYNSGSNFRAFRWTSATGSIDLGTLPGATEATAFAASEHGDVVVGNCDTGSAEPAFLWTAAAGMVNLGSLPGATSYVANAVSVDGLVIYGWAYVGSYERPFRWTASGGMRDLQDDLVNLYGLGSQLAGWSLGHVYGCSPDGRFIVGQGADPAGNGEAWMVRLDAPPQVTATQVNDGSIQRSRVTSLQVTFSTQVSFASTPGAAFNLTRNSDGAAVGFTATANIVGGVTVVTLNGFTGSAAQFGSLADGRYTLTALASQISAGGQQMTSDYHFGDAQGLFRFFGDINGDRHVDIADFGLFSQSLFNPANYNAAFDFNGDGVIDIADFGQFASRMFTMLP